MSTTDARGRSTTRNPLTGRVIIVGGRAWKTLVAEGVLSDDSIGAGAAPNRVKRRAMKASDIVKRASRVTARELVRQPDAYREAMEAASEDYGDDVGRRAAATAEAESEIESRLASMMLEDLCVPEDEWEGRRGPRQPQRSAPVPVPAKKGKQPAARWAVEDTKEEDAPPLPEEASESGGSAGESADEAGANLAALGRRASNVGDSEEDA